MFYQLIMGWEHNPIVFPCVGLFLCCLLIPSILWLSFKFKIAQQLLYYNFIYIIYIYNFEEISKTLKSYWTYGMKILSLKKILMLLNIKIMGKIT